MMLDTRPREFRYKDNDVYNGGKGKGSFVLNASTVSHRVLNWG
jgi:hypothetical protein